jgi:hypothetical protein
VRRSWVWDPDRKELVERTAAATAPGVDAPMVHGDFKPVNVGGVVIEDRGHLRRYLKANDLAPYDPSVAKRARAAKERAMKQDRVRSVVDAYEHVRNQSRAKSRFG